MKKMRMNKIYLTIRKIMRDSRNSMIWMAFTAVLVGVLMVSIYPSIKDAGLEMAEYMETFPDEFLEAFGISSMDMSVFEIYVSTEYFGFFWAMVFFPFIIAWSSMFAKSAEDGTMGLLLSYPISRVELVISYLVDAVAKSFLVAFLMVSVVFLFGYFVDADPQFDNWLKFTLLVAILLSAVSILTVLFSVVFRRRGVVVGVTAALVLGSYFINIISRLYEEVENIKYLSLFHYYGDPVDILLRGEVDSTSILVLLGVSIIASILAIVLGRKMELPRG